MTIRDTWLNLLRALVACVLAIGPAMAFAFVMALAGVPTGIWFIVLIWAAFAVLIKANLDSQARGN